MSVAGYGVPAQLESRNGPNNWRDNNGRRNGSYGGWGTPSAGSQWQDNGGYTFTMLGSGGVMITSGPRSVGTVLQPGSSAYQSAVNFAPGGSGQSLWSSSGSSSSSSSGPLSSVFSTLGGGNQQQGAAVAGSLLSTIFSTVSDAVVNAVGKGPNATQLAKQLASAQQGYVAALGRGDQAKAAYYASLVKAYQVQLGTTQQLQQQVAMTSNGTLSTNVTQQAPSGMPSWLPLAAVATAVVVAAVVVSQRRSSASKGA